MARINPWAIHRALGSAIPEVDLREIARNAGKEVARNRERNREIDRYNKLVRQSKEMTDRAWNLAKEVQKEYEKASSLHQDAALFTKKAMTRLEGIGQLIEKRMIQHLNTMITADKTAADPKNKDNLLKSGAHGTFSNLFFRAAEQSPVGMPLFNGLELAGYDETKLGWRRASILWVWSVAIVMQRVTTHPIMPARLQPVLNTLIEMTKADPSCRPALAYTSIAMAHYTLGPASEHYEDWNIARCFYEMAKNARYKSDTDVIPYEWANWRSVNEDPLAYVIGDGGDADNVDSIFIAKEQSREIRRILDDACQKTYGMSSVAFLNEARLAERGHYANGSPRSDMGERVTELGFICHFPDLYAGNIPDPLRIPMRASILMGMKRIIGIFALAESEDKKQNKENKELLNKIYENWISRSELEKQYDDPNAMFRPL